MQKTWKELVLVVIRRYKPVGNTYTLFIQITWQNLKIYFGLLVNLDFLRNSFYKKPIYGTYFPKDIG